MKHLYKKLYLTFIGGLLVVMAASATVWRITSDDMLENESVADAIGELVAAALPPAGAPLESQRAAIEHFGKRLHIDLALFDEERRPIASVGRRLRAPASDRHHGGWMFGRGGPGWTVRLPDRRWIAARPGGRHRGGGVGFVGFLAGLALAVALCVYPVVRGLTRRLERLQQAVDSLGAGELGARVKVEGRDEVARLAASFNRAATRIEELVGAHKLLLANASHELRTPLSRIRLGLELMGDRPDPKRQVALATDIAELDTLIDQILLSSRLDAVKGLDMREEVDLLALAAEEGARYDECTVRGKPPVMVGGDPALLRRMVRNLIENACAHGMPPVEVDVHSISGKAVLTVSDRGPGIPTEEQERVFSPFQRVAGNRRAEGTGLGLALVRQIARQHGGDAVWIGTTIRPSAIRVTLPVIAGPA